jgi:hypothetical protein
MKKNRQSEPNNQSGIFSSVFGFFRPDTNQIVFLVAAFVLVGAYGVSRLTGENLTAKVEFAEGTKERADFRKSRTQLNSEEIRLGETDPNTLLTERIREASALSIGLGWFVLSERVTDTPKVTESVNELMDNFSQSPLLPPGMTVLNPTIKTDYGLLATRLGVYYVRYRARPLMIEILASGRKGGADGAVFALRIPDRSAAEFAANQPGSSKIKIAGAWASLYIAPDNQNAYIPPPFSPGTAYLNTGWKPEVLRADNFSPEKINELQNFLETAK